MTIEQLRRFAVGHSLFAPPTLSEAIDCLGFVQADPIRSPARAQDLILRHRTEDYRVGELERQYSDLDLEEGLFYTYGFLPERTWRWLHTRNERGLSSFEEKVLAVVIANDTVHPKDLEAYFGRIRATGDWGGQVRATKLALNRLHHRGLLRVVRRDKGIRVYAAAPTREELSADERTRQLVLVAARILAPVQRKTLQETMRMVRRHAPSIGDTAKTITLLLQSGELTEAMVDGTAYVWPANVPSDWPEAGRAVRFLAPFDPVVWDRRRFEQLWGWAYRFEAYVPAPKRIRGYYAMPLLWGDDVIGWANLSVASGKLHVDTGFRGVIPNDPAFIQALADETRRMERFLCLSEQTVAESKKL